MKPFRKMFGRKKDQPFYHLLAENSDAYYVAYVSEQNLEVDATGDPVEHPQVVELFGELRTASTPITTTSLIGRTTPLAGRANRPIGAPTPLLVCFGPGLPSTLRKVVETFNTEEETSTLGEAIVGGSSAWLSVAGDRNVMKTGFNLLLWTTTSRQSIFLCSIHFEESRL